MCEMEVRGFQNHSTEGEDTNQYAVVLLTEDTVQDGRPWWGSPRERACGPHGSSLPSCAGDCSGPVSTCPSGLSSADPPPPVPSKQATHAGSSTCRCLKQKAFHVSPGYVIITRCILKLHVCICSRGDNLITPTSTFQVCKKKHLNKS